MYRHRQTAFTIVELLVVVSIIGVLVALMMPALGSLRESSGQTKCASNLRQLGIAIANYRAIYDDSLPQYVIPNPFFPEGKIVSSFLFGGKIGQMPAWGVNEIGADQRPLNVFLNSGPLTDEDLPEFECPLDRGQPPGIVGGMNLPDIDSLYDFLGTSYALNDHTLDANPCWTLIPPGTPDKPGGRMPSIEDPTRTWIAGDMLIYNYVGAQDRGQRWHRHDTICNLCFVDGHVEQGIRVPESTLDDDGFIAENTTKRFTFLPNRNWLNRCTP